jgi:CheY-like chemotaxis protein
MANPGRSVLLVDDHEDTREGYATYLRWAGYAPSLASTGEEALARAEQVLPDVVVMDVHMPGMSGLAVVEALRSSAATRGIPIILLTGEGRALDDEDRRRDVKMLLKPVRPADLLAHIDRLLEASGA